MTLARSDIEMYGLTQQSTFLAAASDAARRISLAHESQHASMVAAEHQRLVFEKRQQLEALHVERFKREQNSVMAAYSHPTLRSLHDLENSPAVRAMRKLERAMSPIREYEKYLASMRTFDQFVHLFPTRDSALGGAAALMNSEHATIARMTELMRPAHLDVVRWLDESAFGRGQYDLRMAQSHMALARNANALLGAFGATDVATPPEFIYSAPVIAPFISAQATSLMLDFDEDIEAEEVQESASLVLKSTKHDREKLLMACDPKIPELLGAARQALAIGGPDCTARVCTSLRRCVDFAVDSVAPIDVVLTWNDPRNTMRSDRKKEPTRISRLLYATRACDGAGALGKMLHAQLLTIDGIMGVLNRGIHAERDGIECIVLELVIEQTEAFLHSLALGYRLTS